MYLVLYKELLILLIALVKRKWITSVSWICSLLFYVSQILGLLCIIDILVFEFRIFSLYSLPHPPDSTLTLLVITLRLRIPPFVVFITLAFRTTMQSVWSKIVALNMAVLIQKDIKWLQLKLPFSRNYYVYLNVIEQLVRFSIPGTLFTITWVYNSKSSLGHIWFIFDFRNDASNNIFNNMTFLYHVTASIKKQCSLLLTSLEYL